MTILSFLVCSVTYFKINSCMLGTLRAVIEEWKRDYLMAACHDWRITPGTVVLIGSTNSHDIAVSETSVIILWLTSHMVPAWIGSLKKMEPVLKLSEGGKLVLSKKQILFFAFAWLIAVTHCYHAFSQMQIVSIGKVNFAFYIASNLEHQGIKNANNYIIT